MASTGRQRLGYIGLGGMGSRMAKRLVDAGHALVVYNRSPNAADELAKAGATVAKSPGELAGQADVIFSSLADDAAVEAVLREAFGGAAADTLFVEMSTISVAASKRLHERAAAAKLRMIDCPVSGSTPAAASGQLVLLAGGDAATIDSVRPLLHRLGKAVLHTGGPTSGHLTKLCVNTLLGIGVQALAESIALGERGGLDRATLLDALGNVAVISPGQKLKLPNALTDDYPPTFPLRLMNKDFGLVLDQAKQTNLDLPATRAAHGVSDAGVKAGLGDQDLAVVIRTVRDGGAKA